MNVNSLKSFSGRLVIAITACVLLGAGSSLRAQAPDYPSPQSAPTRMLSAGELDDLVAPIALYPDPMLSQVLVASTYPLEVVEAQQWLQRNNRLSGAQLVDTARQQNWDASVQALVAFPDVLARMNQDVRWTIDLGNAFLAQQADVMRAVQRMRTKAEANGKLSSTEQQTVTNEAQGGQSAIQIQPADPQVVYVPSYDPMYIWGPPVWGAYPSLYYPGFGFGFGPGIDLGLCFSGWGGYGWGGWGGWGWGPNWFGRTVIVNNGFMGRYGFRGNGGVFRGGRSVWAHDPAHRLGVPYPNRQLAGRFQSASVAAGRAVFGRSVGGNSFGRFYGANRNRPAMPANQNFRSAGPVNGASRSYPAPQRFQGRPAVQNSPRMSAPGGARSFGGSRAFGGGGGGGHFGGGGGHSGGGGGGGGHRR